MGYHLIWFFIGKKRTVAPRKNLQYYTLICNRRLSFSLHIRLLINMKIHRKGDKKPSRTKCHSHKYLFAQESKVHSNFTLSEVTRKQFHYTLEAEINVTAILNNYFASFSVISRKLLKTCKLVQLNNSYNVNPRSNV